MHLLRHEAMMWRLAAQPPNSLVHNFVTIHPLTLIVAYPCSLWDWLSYTSGWKGRSCGVGDIAIAVGGSNGSLLKYRMCYVLELCGCAWWVVTVGFDSFDGAPSDILYLISTTTTRYLCTTPLCRTRIVLFLRTATIPFHVEYSRFLSGVELNDSIPYLPRRIGIEPTSNNFAIICWSHCAKWCKINIALTLFYKTRGVRVRNIDVPCAIVCPPSYQCANDVVSLPLYPASQRRKTEQYHREGTYLLQSNSSQLLRCAFRWSMREDVKICF
jgi:hypothetical protein